MDDLTEDLENNEINDGNPGRTEITDNNKASGHQTDPKVSEGKTKARNGLFGLLKSTIVHFVGDTVVVTVIVGLGALVYYGVAKVFHLEEDAMDIKKKAFREFWESIKDRDEYK